MRIQERPSVVAIAGPNGSGKSTVGPSLLRGPLQVAEFVNADTIAQGLSALAPERTALLAGRVMLDRVKELARRKVSFAFETTLAGRSYARWLSDLARAGYDFHVVFLWLPSADLAVRRVADRVRLGGHHVPEETVRRRFEAGISNFLHVYRRLATSWAVYDNSGPAPALVAAGRGSEVTRVADEEKWRRYAGKSRT